MKVSPMYKDIGDGKTEHITLFLIPQFSMIAFTSILEPMRLVNQIAERDLYSWEIVSRDGLPVMASNGIEITPHTQATEVVRPSNVVVCSGLDAHIYNDALTFGYLRRWAREGAHMGAICTGAHVLAHAGLLNGYRCTIHWENLDSFSEEFPDIDVQAELYEIDRDRFTCAGGTSALDMTLSEISRKHGSEIAGTVSEQFMHERIREGDDNQRLPLQARLRVSHPKLIKAISEMEKHTEEALSRDEIARRVGLSRRQLERLFSRYLSTSPARYYLKLRLGRARKLLTQTTMPVTEVAFASGFTSASHFSKCYRDMFGKTPRAERRGLDLDYDEEAEMEELDLHIDDQDVA